MKPNAPTLPLFIALCGNPTAGKTEVQRILQENYAVQPVDDGGPLRAIAMQYLGLTREQCYTQEGKQQFVEINGKSWQVRDILGELGNAFELKFGGDIIPLMVVNNLPKTGSYSFGSVRRQQGRFYKKQHGVVIGIRNPLAGPSKFEFDRFDETAVDYWIDNDALARGMDPFDARKNLEAKIHQFVIDYSWAKAAD